VRLADAIFRRLEGGHVRIYRRRELESMIQAAGLDPIDARTACNGYYMIVTSLLRPR
jgi:hypothetical protein